MAVFSCDVSALVYSLHVGVVLRQAVFVPLAACLWIFGGFSFQDVSGHHFMKHQVCFIAADLQRTENHKMDSCNNIKIWRCRSPMREKKQGWKQKELCEVTFITADSFIGTCRRATLLIIYTYAICGHVE